MSQWAGRLVRWPVEALIEGLAAPSAYHVFQPSEGNVLYGVCSLPYLPNF